ncbi:hypothetical protein C8R42DRAFT_646655, partial [Lentinula raphanica]
RSSWLYHKPDEASTISADRDIAYRVVLPTETFKDEPQLRALVDEPRIRCWIGPGRHVVGYCISVLESKLLICRPLETWIHESGRVVLLGILVIQCSFNLSPTELKEPQWLSRTLPFLITPLLDAYQHLRYARATATQNSSTRNRDIYHLPDGAEQEERDAAMRRAMEMEILDYEKFKDREYMSMGDHRRVNPNAWLDKTKNWQDQFDYDPDMAVEEWWSSNRET